ncbi:MAG TPA: class I SAM-dependent methyltransferase, partial [Terriglobales bacterium]|nr:class I SAM-dependent methyltransferase [Terriglobales bacterium]
YRPGYPPEVIEFLREECGLTRDSVVADIASGTGLWTLRLLENGNPVFGVEPNEEMRKAGEQYLAEFPRFTSIGGTAEATTLPDHSVDMITTAQAAHWFDRVRARREFMRILKPAGWTVLLWNERLTDSTPFLRAYEKLLLDYGTDYKEVRHERTIDEIRDFFAPSPYKEKTFDSAQRFDYEGLEGRLLSSSYTPQAGHPKYAPMLKRLRAIFDDHQVNGNVDVAYDTKIFYGVLEP